MPDIEFRNSQKTEEKRWRSTWKEVENGWFGDHGFLVFPGLQKNVAPQIQVVLPPEVDYAPTQVEPFVREWQRVEEAFWTELDHYLPEARRMHQKVIVDIGEMGTVSSCYWTTSHYYLRVDRGVGDLAAMIVNRTLFEIRREVGVTWTKREALTDFIMTRPVMKRLFPDFAPIYTQLLQVPPIVRDESRRYVASLGIVMPGKELAVLQGKVYVKNVAVDRAIGRKEKILLKLLVQNQGELVSYDELADAIWGEGEFKSFWALAKLIERLRGGLATYGIEKSRIESVRGQGYLLR